MATETAIFKAVLDASDFDPAANRMRTSVADAGSQLATGGTALKGFQVNIEKAATSVSGMSSVLGGMGSKAGATFGAVSNLSSAFLAGGPLLLGMAVATTGVSVLINHFSKLEEAQAKARAESKRLADEFSKTLATELASVTKNADAARTALRNLRFEKEFGVKNFGGVLKASDELADAELEAFQIRQRAGKDQAKQLAALERLENDLAGTLRNGRLEERAAAKAKIQEQKEILEKSQKQTTADLQRLEVLQKTIPQLNKALRAEREMVDERSAEAKIEAEKKRGEQAQAAFDKRARAFEARQKEAAQRAKEAAQKNLVRDEETGLEYDRTDPDAVAFVQQSHALNRIEERRLKHSAKQRQLAESRRAAAIASAEMSLKGDNEAATHANVLADQEVEAERKKVDAIIAELKRLDGFRKSLGDTSQDAVIANLERQLGAHAHIEKAKTELFQRGEDQRIAILQKSAEIRNDIQQQMVQLAESTAQSAASTGFQVVEDLIAGEEKVLEKALIAMMKMIGGQLVGIGISGVFRGAINSADPLMPGSGGPQMAMGAAAIAAGMAMGGAGAVGSGMMRRSGAQSSSMRDVTPRSNGTRGNSPRSMGAGGDGTVHNTTVFQAGVVIGDPSSDARKLRAIRRRSEMMSYVGGGY